MNDTVFISIVSTASKYEAMIAGIVATLWLITIVLLHFIKPQLKPSIRLISEYAIRPHGWIMQSAFFCMAFACLMSALAAWPYIPGVGLVLLAFAGLGCIGAGIFTTVC